jgi:FAD/FMN-containing dehydrogenase
VDAPPGLLSDVAAVVGPAQVLVDPALTAAYDTDWTGLFRGRSAAVVRVGSTSELSSVLRLCGAAGQPVVLQGGNTGLVAGATPRDGDVIVSLRRLAHLSDPDAGGQLTVGAGTTLAAVQERARAFGWEFGVDLAARDSATIGGMTATNAGGVNVVRHGSMRAQIRGLEFVLADGTVIDRLNRPAKDNTGYDLPDQLIGSEGTLAAISRIRLQLVRPPRHRAVALIGFDSLAAAVATVQLARTGEGPQLQAAEVMFAPGLALVCAYLRVAAPFAQPPQVVLLLEFGGSLDPLGQLADVVAKAPGVGDAVVADDSAGRARLWRYREAHTEMLAAVGPPVKLDVALPAGLLTEGITAMEQAAHGVVPDSQLVVFGHLAEANLHVNVLGADHAREQIADAVLRAVAALGGSISAEHGVGRAKTGWLGLSRSPAEVRVLRGIKRAWDPASLLAAGVLLPAEVSEMNDDSH